jgi:2-C-methyl-D-erythritol 4-phosphate cytidylyltransferase
MIIDNITIKKKFHFIKHHDIFDNYRKKCKNKIFNPNIIIQCITHKLKIIPFEPSVNIVWFYKKKYIITSNNKYLSNINNQLVLTTHHNTKWNLSEENYIYDDDNNYISSDIYNNLFLSKKSEIKIYFYKNMLLSKKNKFQIMFEINNCIYKVLHINVNDFESKLNNKNNAGILLAGGNSTRFGSSTVKQLYILEGMPIILHSLKIMSSLLDIVVIITNSKSFFMIEKLIKNYTNVKLLINDIDCRLESIFTGLKYLSTMSINKVIIHDSARPYIKDYHIHNLLKSTKKYTHYCAKITNGLFNYNIADINRDDYVQLCSPLSINYNLAYFIYKYYMNKHRITSEFIYIIKLLGVEYEFIFDSETFLKKITYKNDIV